MESRTFAYIRVSTKEQNEDCQRIAIKQFGVEEGNIYMDKQSGKDFNRPEYKRLIRRHREGDTLVVTSIDCLGRN